VGNAQLVEKLPPRGNPFSVSRVSTGDRLNLVSDLEENLPHYKFKDGSIMI
jgi:hypothetical protein